MHLFLHPFFLRLTEVKEIFLMLTQGTTIKKSYLFAKIA